VFLSCAQDGSARAAFVQVPRALFARWVVELDSFPLDGTNMRDPLKTSPVVLAAAALTGNAVVVAAWWADHSGGALEDFRTLAALSISAFAAELCGLWQLDRKISRLPRPKRAETVLANNLAGAGIHAFAFVLGTFGALIPGLAVDAVLQRDHTVPGLLAAALGTIGLGALATWISTTGELVWFSQEDGHVTARREFTQVRQVPLSDFMGVRVRRWRHSEGVASTAELVHRTGDKGANVSLQNTYSVDAANREADRVAALTGLPRLPLLDTA